MSTITASESQPIFSPVWLAVIVAAVALFAWVVQYDIQVPTVVIISVIGAIGTAIFAAGLIRPEVPLLALTAYVPFSKVLVGGFGELMTAFNLTNLLMVMILLGHVLRTMAQRKPLIEANALNLPVVLFCALGAVSLVRGVLAGYGEEYALTFLIPLKRWLTPIALYLVTYNVVQDRRTVRQVLVIIMIVVAVAALMAIKDYIDVGPNSSLDHSRIGGIAEQPNMLGAFFVYYMFLFAAFWMMNWTRVRYWLLLLPFGLCFRGIQVTFSRGAYLAFAMGGVALAFFRNKFLWVAVSCLLAFAVLNPWVLPKGIAQRLQSTVQDEQVSDVYGDPGILNSLDASSAHRLEIWGGAVRMIAEHPLTGVGYGVFPYLIHSYAPNIQQMDAHNSYLIIAAEMGVPALLVFLWILIVIGWKTRWLYRHAQDPFFKAMALGWLAGLAGLLVANMFGSRLHSEEISAYFWILCALIMRAVAIERREGLEAVA